MRLPDFNIFGMPGFTMKNYKLYICYVSHNTINGVRNGAFLHKYGGVHKYFAPVVSNRRSRGRERSSEGRSFQTEGPTIEKALFCLVAVRARGTRKSPLVAERRDRRPEQAEVRLKSSCSPVMSRTKCCK